MYLVLIAWIYVAFMMAIAEATSPVGSLLGAAITFLLYGVLPMSVVGYIMGSPARRRALKAKEAKEAKEAEEREANSTANDRQDANEKAQSVAPNTHREASGHPIASVRKEP
jgi:membrane protein implicated in regulation of membrane protease activity